MDWDEINRRFEEGAEEALLEYTARSVEAYVSEHAGGLHISGFRRVESFDSPIEPTEYRIALRVGTKPIDGEPLNDRSFDYHLWAQVDDGRWCQKFPGDYSEIIPGTAHDIDPAVYPWNAARLLNNDRVRDFYGSRIVYFAAVKDGAEFTSHRTNP
jgi:hypothetical protein